MNARMVKHRFDKWNTMARLSVVPADTAPPITDAVDLSLRLIEKLALAAEPQGVSDLARELGSSKATVYRHLQTLAVHGFARQDAASSRYTAGIKLLVLGERLRERFDIVQVAREEMVQLRDETQQPVTLSTLVDRDVVVLEVLHGHAIINFGTQAGTVLDLHASAHGKIALAYGPDALLQRCLSKQLKPWTSHTICSHQGLQRAITQVKSRGWATAPNQVLDGVNGLAAPIFNYTGAYAGAIAIAGSIQYIPANPPTKQIKAVTRAAERISRKLGWQPR
jgi:DNA-binding IclR family transcriptional regulator